VAIESDQEPDAAQDVALVEDQVIVKELLTSTELTLEVIVAVGAAGSVTVTEAESVALPPAPVQVIVYVLDPAVDSEKVLVPEVAIESDQSPDAVQAVAFVEDQVRVKSVLTSTELVLEERVAVGAGVVPPPLPPVLPPPVSPPPPPPPPQAVKRDNVISEQ
jgi:hypothetical protein